LKSTQVLDAVLMGADQPSNQALQALAGVVASPVMVREEHRHPVWAEFRTQLARDRTRTTVSGFSKLVPVEMTRKRPRERLAHMLCEPCPTGEGRGLVKTVRRVRRHPARNAAVRALGVPHRHHRGCGGNAAGRAWRAQPEVADNQ